MTKRHLTESEIKEMAEWAVNNYEFSCSWKTAFYEAAYYAADKFNVKATKAKRQLL